MVNIKSRVHAPSYDEVLTHFHLFSSKRFHSNNFTYCLTLFSKCFSSFPHGTCSLSVSRLYLALDGFYHPFRSAFPNKPTLGVCLVTNRVSQCNRVITFCDVSFQRVLARPCLFLITPLHSTTRPRLLRAISNVSWFHFTRRYCGNPR